MTSNETPIGRAGPTRDHFSTVIDFITSLPFAKTNLSLGGSNVVLPCDSS